MSLEFNEATHQYAWAGQLVPSVTQILKPMGDYGGIPPAVLAKAAERGTAAHLATELDDAGTLDPDSISDEIRPYLEAWRAFKRERGAVILESEKKVYSLTHRYAGTLDRVLALDDGSEWMVDIKTSKTIKAAAGPQTAAYHAAYGLAHLRRAVVQLNNDGTYRFHEFTNGRDWVVFQACLLIHRFTQEKQDV